MKSWCLSALFYTCRGSLCCLFILGCVHSSRLRSPFRLCYLFLSYSHLPTGKLFIAPCSSSPILFLPKGPMASHLPHFICPCYRKSFLPLTTSGKSTFFSFFSSSSSSSSSPPPPFSFLLLDRVSLYSPGRPEA